MFQFAHLKVNGIIELTLDFFPLSLGLTSRAQAGLFYNFEHGLFREAGLCFALRDEVDVSLVDC